MRSAWQSWPTGETTVLSRSNFRFNFFSDPPKQLGVPGPMWEIMWAYPPSASTWWRKEMAKIIQDLCVAPKMLEELTSSNWATSHWSWFAGSLLIIIVKMMMKTFDLSVFRKVKITLASEPARGWGCCRSCCLLQSFWGQGATEVHLYICIFSSCICMALCHSMYSCFNANTWRA